MMIVYPGGLRVLHLTRRSEVFVPASEYDATRFYAAFDRELFDRELPRRIRPIIDVLDEAFPRVADAYRWAGIAAPVARIGIALEQYDFEPDAVVDEIHRRTSVFDLKLDFRSPHPDAIGQQRLAAARSLPGEVKPSLRRAEGPISRGATA
jgi:hypothetical protein